MVGGTMYDDILIPTDGSEGVKPAIEHGLDVANTYDATIHALHVIDLTDIQEELLPDIPDEWKREGDIATQQIADQARDLNLDVITDVSRGTPYEVILNYVDDHDIDFISMGTHGRSGLKKFLLGSVTERVVGGASVPVLCVRRSEERIELTPSQLSYEHILIPTDGSKSARRATDHGLELARTYDATVHALNVVDRTVYASRPGMEWDDSKEILERAGKRATDRIADTADEAGLSVVTAVRDGVPHRIIGEYANEHEIDLIAMGTHGRTGLSKWMIGSVTERVLQTATVPVLTVRAP